MADLGAKREQVLTSGLTIRQDFRGGARMVFFDTGLDGWRYATHGGTAFVVNFQGRPYVFTCRHVLQDFEWRQIVITERKFGHLVPGLKSVSYPSRPQGDAMEAEVLDVAAIKFSEDITPAFFGDTAYLLDRGTVETSATGDRLRVAGALKVESEIDETVIAPVYCLLKFTDAGNSTNDPTMRCAVAKFADPEFASLTGLSGAHVFNETGNALRHGRARHDKNSRRKVRDALRGSVP